jgi:hypothetical protein
MNPELKLEN